MMKLKDVRFHFLDVIHIPSFLTFCSMSGISASRSDGVRRSRMVEVSFSRGNTLKRIMVAMNREQMGSAMFQPKFSIRTDDIMTPTLPRVSARTCKNTPTMQSNENIHFILPAVIFRWANTSQIPLSHGYRQKR